MEDIQFQNQVLRYYIYKKTQPFHQWNDGWVFWNDLNKAIQELDVYFKKARVLAYTKEKWGAYRVSVLTMYDGTLKSILQPSVRKNFDWFYWSKTLYKLSQIEEKDPNSNFYAFVAECSNWLDHKIRKYIVPSVNFVLKQISRVDYFIANPHLPFYHEYALLKEECEHPTLYQIDKWIKNHIRFIPKMFIKLVNKCQVQKVNEGFQKVCLKYPHIVHELVYDVDVVDWIKPYGKYILDGQEIWKQHWTTIDKI